MNKDFCYYMHEGPGAIRFELAGHLSNCAARELAKRVVSSSGRGHSLIIDLSYVTGVDGERAMLRGWYADGAQLVAKAPLARTIIEPITHEGPTLIAETARSQTWVPVFLVSLLAIMPLLGTFEAEASFHQQLTCVESRSSVSGEWLSRCPAQLVSPSRDRKHFDLKNVPFPPRSMGAGS
jgi:hypothetical protein